MKISEQTKRLIIEKVVSQSYLTSFYYDSRFIQFLNGLLDLKKLPSEDPRYNDAEADAQQHLVNNQDWELSYLFTQRFDFISNTTLFVKLLNQIVHHDYCPNNDELQKIVIQTNRFLEKEKYTYSISDYSDENLPIYQVMELKDEDIELIHKKNRIPIYVIFSPTNTFKFTNVHPKPPVFPSFNLVLNSVWNDYGLISEYCLFYYNSANEETKIGELKILSDNIRHIERNTSLEGDLPNNFTELDDTFCSLGQSTLYYQNLKRILGNDFENFLWSMKDCAFFPIILEKYENHPYFKSSLIRNDNQEQLLREIKYNIYGLNPATLYSFTYKFKPKFTKEEKEILLDFKNEFYFDRIYSIIGKNGVGKTQFVSSLPIEIAHNNSKLFNPSTPQFSKVIAVSYSAFDNFIIPKPNANFNYVFCGLKNREGNKLSDSGLVNRFHHSWKKIKECNRFSNWIKLLRNFIEEEYINEMFNEEGDELDINSFGEIRKKLSSGQTLLLYIITEIVANIRNNSLILYDEPETHLHPNAISQLINTLFQLLERFDSYCIITTHSPLIIRELTSKNVYVFDRNDSYFNIKQLPIETYGENLTTLTDEVFGNRSIENKYKKALETLVANNLSYEQIIERISGDLPLSLNASLYLQNLIDEKE